MTAPEEEQGAKKSLFTLIFDWIDMGDEVSEIKFISRIVLFSFSVVALMVAAGTAVVLAVTHLAWWMTVPAAAYVLWRWLKWTFE